VRDPQLLLQRIRGSRKGQLNVKYTCLVALLVFTSTMACLHVLHTIIMLFLCRASSLKCGNSDLLLIYFVNCVTRSLVWLTFALSLFRWLNAFKPIGCHARDIALSFKLPRVNKASGPPEKYNLCVACVCSVTCQTHVTLELST
jgi:hypothetical protein